MSTIESVYSFIEDPIIWPKEIKMYLPKEKGKTFLPDMASSLSIQAFLKMCDVQFSVLFKDNVEEMSPSGQVPVMKCDIFLMSGLETVVQFFEERGILLTGSLEASQRAEVKAYISLINMTLVNAENFLIWADQDIYATETKVKFSSVYSWPLNLILAERKRQKVLNKLDALGWSKKTLKEVCEDVDLCFGALSNKLEGKYFFGKKPSELDAVVFAHVYVILTTPLCKTHFPDLLLCYPGIVQHCENILNDFFPELSLNHTIGALGKIYNQNIE